MNTVERVAEKINCIGVGPHADYQLTDALYMAHKEAYGGFESGMVETAEKDLNRIAKAALNALADGLDWGGMGGRLLCLNDVVVGQVYGLNHPNDQHEIEINWGYWLGLAHDDSKVFQTEQEAREALMAAARKWLIGD